jgi:hypothetical protein
MRFYCVFTSVLLALLWTIPIAAQDLPIYSCVKTSTPPTIDGSGDDAAWNSAVYADFFDVNDLARQRQHSRTTRVKMLWDDEQLYFYFELSDPDIWSTFSGRDDQLWQEEAVEIYLDPDGDGQNYAEIEINPLNAVFDLLLSRPWGAGGRGFNNWNPDFARAVHIDGTLNDDGDNDVRWSVEVALPWQALSTDIRDVMNGQALPPQSGDSWRLNLYRFERLRSDGAIISSEASAWSTVGNEDFHTPERFGFLSFVEAATAVEQKAWSQVKRERR